MGQLYILKSKKRKELFTKGVKGRFVKFTQKKSLYEEKTEFSKVFSISLHLVKGKCSIS